MKVIQVKCPKCERPITMKQPDKFFFCAQCGTLHMRENGVETLNFEIAEFAPRSQGEGLYIPFWRFTCTLIIRSKNVQGGALFKLSQMLGGKDSGILNVFVPAAEMDLNTFRTFATMFTTVPPRYGLRMNFGGIKNAPATVTRDEAIELADFVVVTLEAEQPGVLQNLDYTLSINDAKVVYLPFIVTPGGLQPAL